MKQRAIDTDHIKTGWQFNEEIANFYRPNPYFRSKGFYEDKHLIELLPGSMEPEEKCLEGNKPKEGSLVAVCHRGPGQNNESEPEKHYY